MNKKKIFGYLLMGLILIGSLITLYIWSDNIAPDNSGAAYYTEKIVRSILLVIAAWITTRLVTLAVLDPINSRRKKALPNIVKDIIGFVIYFIVMIIILTEVFGKTIGHLGWLLGSSWAIIGFAAKDLIADCIFGISLDLQADFEIGDWLQFKDGTIGKIIEMKMTGADLILPNQTILYVSNAMLCNEPMINLSKPTRDYFIAIDVVLEHNVPVGRGRRILLSAVTGNKMVFGSEAKVFAESVQDNGVVYAVYFKCADRSVWLETRHQAIQSVTETLHKFGLKICQIKAEFNINSLDKVPSLEFNDSFVIDAFSALKNSKLLQGFDDQIQKQFAEKMIVRKFSDEEVIVKSGDEGESMFIVAEGIVEVYLDIDYDKTREDDDETHKVASLVDGEYFGEQSLLLGEKRTATVISQSDSILYEINRKSVKEFVENNPEFAEKLSASIIKRNERNAKFTNEKVEERENSEKMISEFANAFKKFLWDH